MKKIIILCILFTSCKSINQNISSDCKYTRIKTTVCLNKFFEIENVYVSDKIFLNSQNIDSISKLEYKNAKFY